jgi:hypothetical protein
VRVQPGVGLDDVGGHLLVGVGVEFTNTILAEAEIQLGAVGFGIDEQALHPAGLFADFRHFGDVLDVGVPELVVEVADPVRARAVALDRARGVWIFRRILAKPRVEEREAEVDIQSGIARALDRIAHHLARGGDVVPLAAPQRVDRHEERVESTVVRELERRLIVDPRHHLLVLLHQKRRIRFCSVVERAARGEGDDAGVNAGDFCIRCGWRARLRPSRFRTGRFRLGGSLALQRDG